MSTSIWSRNLASIGALASGFVAGYFFFDHSSEVRDLRYRLALAEARLAILGTARAGGPTHRWLATVPGTELPAVGTNTVPPLITEEDIKVALEMNDRASHGEYILQFERPVDRKLMEAGIKAFAAQLGSNNAPKLDAEFAQLGVSPEKAQQLEVHNQKITLASLEAEQAIQQVLLARNEYDKLVRSLLPDDAYSAYRQYEDSQPAAREYDSLQNYATQNNVSLDPAYQQQILGLIQQSQAYTCGWWHGPYDGLPPIGVGQEMITKQLLDQVGQISQAANLLSQTAASLGLPDQYINLLNGYYAQIIQSKQQTIIKLNIPPEPVASNK